MRSAAAGALLLLLCSACACAGRSPDVDEAPPLATPAWAFEPWISKDISDGADTRAFLDGFRERDIPVGVVVLDSPWETNYNTFVPNEERYPELGRMIGELRDEGVRTVLWTTQTVNDSSFDIEAGGDVYDGPADGFAEGQVANYFVNDGETALWWKGTGAAVDFFNDDAVAWWRAKQNALLDLGVAGWKLDFGEQYLVDFPLRTAAGEKSLQEYSEAYYRDFWVHGAARAGVDEFITMVRPYDESYGFAPRFYARPEHAPVAWVGDQRRDRVGLVDALDHIFRSAQAGYAVVGSDIGGYLDIDFGEPVPFELDTFRRWTAASALMPFFQLHGRANLAPWTVPVDDAAAVDATVRQYRYWATLHHALVPYFFSLTREAQARGVGVLEPVGGGPGDWLDDWRFRAGPAFLVAPITDGAAERDVELPDDAAWLDWWDLDGPALSGTVSVRFVADGVREMPLYVREGSIVPMRIDSDVIGLGSASFRSALTVLAFPGPAPASFVLHDESEPASSPAPSATATLTLAGTRLALGGVRGLVIVRMHGVGNGGGRVLVDGVPVPERASLPALAGAGADGYARDGGAIWIAARDAREVRVER